MNRMALDQLRVFVAVVNGHDDCIAKCLLLTQATALWSWRSSSKKFPDESPQQV